jgi:hypothetical protein
MLSRLQAPFPALNIHRRTRAGCHISLTDVWQGAHAMRITNSSLVNGYLRFELGSRGTPTTLEEFYLAEIPLVECARVDVVPCHR